MDYKYLELEYDAIEERGGGRVPSEIAKSRRNDGHLSPYPSGIPAGLIEHKERKTKIAVGARITQVMRRQQAE